MLPPFKPVIVEDKKVGSRDGQPKGKIKYDHHDDYPCMYFGCIKMPLFSEPPSLTLPCVFRM